MLATYTNCDANGHTNLNTNPKTVSEVNGNRLLYAIVAGLTVALIAGGVKLGMAQAGDRVRIANVESVQADSARAIADVPIISNEIGHIKDSIEDIEATQGKILDAIGALER